METEGPALKLVEGYHGSMTRVAFSPDSSYFTAVWQKFELEEYPTQSLNMYSFAFDRLACFEDEGPFTSKLPSPNDICRVRQATMHSFLVEPGSHTCPTYTTAIMTDWSKEPTVPTVCRRWAGGSLLKISSTPWGSLLQLSTNPLTAL